MVEKAQRESEFSTLYIIGQINALNKLDLKDRMPLK